MTDRRGVLCPHREDKRERLCEYYMKFIQSRLYRQNYPIEDETGARIFIRDNGHAIFDLLQWIRKNKDKAERTYEFYLYYKLERDYHVLCDNYFNAQLTPSDVNCLLEYSNMRLREKFWGLLSLLTTVMAVMLYIKLVC